MDKQLLKPESHASVESNALYETISTSATQQQMDREAARAVGQELARLREARQWNIDDISAHLKVSVAKLRALEAGELDNSLDMIFVIGIVRSYAKMLDIDPAPLVDKLRQARGLPEPRLELPGPEKGKLPRYYRPLAWTVRLRRRRLWSIAGVFALILALSILLLRQYGSGWAIRLVREKGMTPNTHALVDQPGSIQKRVSQTQRASAPEMHPQLPVTDMSTEISPKEISVPDMQSASDSAPERLIAQPTEDVQRLESNTQSTLHFKVSENTWISVRQGDDQKVYMGLLSAGEERDIQGKPPLYIIVGNVAGLESLELDGQLIEPTKYKYTENNVAHFSLP